jgi:putative phosphoribosyl transferase
MAGFFRNRRDAGRQLAERLKAYAGRSDVTVLALPRGGVPVGYEVAKALGAPLDVLVVRKLGVPQQPELAMGAIASGDARFLVDDVFRNAHVSRAALHAVEDRERAELARREKLYRGTRAPLQVRGRVVILVDDGIATGASIQVAAMALRSLHPGHIVVAVPVAPVHAAQRLGDAVDEFVCVYAPRGFHAVGQFYEDFGQTTDEEVRDLIEHPREAHA